MIDICELFVDRCFCQVAFDSINHFSRQKNANDFAATDDLQTYILDVRGCLQFSCESCNLVPIAKYRNLTQQIDVLIECGT